MHLRAHLVALALLTSPAIAQQGSALAGTSSSASAQLQIAQTTEVPGTSLSHGSYSIRIADRLQDRLIVQIQKSGSQTFTSLLGYPNPSLRSGSSAGPVLFGSGLKGKPTLRGYAFPGGPVVEFVFPKQDAVDLAKSNSIRVMAVDTASEGKVALPNLTQTDMSEVTLWMLTPTAVDPATSKPGIQAARYQAPVATEDRATAPSSSDSTQSASAAPVQPSSVSSTRPATNAPVQVASNHPPRLRPAIKQLPHTASSLPLISLVGWVSLLSAGCLALRRKFYSL